MRKKIYFIYKANKNPNLKKTYERLENVFGKGYIFGKKYSNAKNMEEKEMKDKFTKDMKKGKFTLTVVDVTHGKGRFMKQEIALAKKLKIPLIEVNFLKWPNK